MPYFTTVKGRAANTFKEKYESLVFKLYINDKLITSMKVDEMLNYKIYSKGRIAFSLLDQSGLSSGIIDITENKTYYAIIAHEYRPDKKTAYLNQEITVEIADKLKTATWFPYKRTISIEEDISNPVGTISSETLASGPKSGTGFLLSESGLVVTNHHVIEKGKKIELKGINGDYTTTYSAKVLVDDEKNDLAILQIENKSIKFMPIPYTIRSKSADTGEEIYVLGYPLKKIMGDEVNYNRSY
jgi:S1-C subfamily serine protease